MDTNKYLHRRWRPVLGTLIALLLMPLLTIMGIAEARAQSYPQPSLSPVYGKVGTPVNFAAAVVFPTGTAVSQFQWDFGDGQTGFGQSVTHSYAAPGTYQVTLSALGPSGVISSATTTATIAPTAVAINSVTPGLSSVVVPSGNIGVNVGGPYAGTAGGQVFFGGTQSGAIVPQFLWDFGDGQTAGGSSVSHIYAASGTYTVRLTVTDSITGQSATGATTASIGAGVQTVVGAAAPTLGTAPVVTYAAGWNLVAGPGGTPFPQSLSPLYTWRPGDTIYEVLNPTSGVQAGFGYWAYFAQPASVPLTGAGMNSAATNVSAGQWSLVGNPSATEAVVIHGADLAVRWNAQTGQYQNVEALAPGAGAWVFVRDGGTVTLSP